MWRWISNSIRWRAGRQLCRLPVSGRNRYVARLVPSARLLLQMLEERTVPTVSLFDGSNNFVRNFSGANAIQLAVNSNIQNAHIIVYNDQFYSDFAANVAGQTIIGRDVSASGMTFPFQGDANVPALGSAVSAQATVNASGAGTTVMLSGNNVTIDNLNLVYQTSSDSVGIMVSGNSDTIRNSTIGLYDRGIVVNGAVSGLGIASNSISTTDNALDLAGANSTTILGDRIASGNAIGINVTGGTLTIGAGNTVIGGITGLQLSGAVSLTGNTINNIAFSGQTGAGARYIRLLNGALAGIEIDATNASFDGFVGSAAALPASLSTFYATEDRIDDVLDAPGVGFVRLKSGNLFLTLQSENTTAVALQRAVDVAAPGDIIHMTAGRFEGNPTISTPVTIQGAQVGVAGGNPNRQPDNPITDTIVFDDGFDVDSEGAPLITIATSNVTLDGLTLDAEGNATYGLLADGSAVTISGVTLRNSIVENTDDDAVNILDVPGLVVQSNMIRGINNADGIVVASDMGPIDGNVIQGNILNGTDSGIVLTANVYGLIGGNMFIGVGDSIDVSGYSAADAGSVLTIDSNVMTSGGTGISIINVDLPSLGAIAITNNQMTVAGTAFDLELIGAAMTFSGNSATGGNAGISLYDVIVPGGLQIQASTVSGSETGVTVFNDGNSYGGSMKLTLDHLTVSGAATALSVSDGASGQLNVSVVSGSLSGNNTGVYIYGSSAAVTLTGVTVSTLGSDGTGVDVTAGSAARLLNNTITGNAVGVLVDGSAALLQGNDLRNNTVDGANSAGLLVRDNAKVDAGQDNPTTPAVEGTNFTGLGISQGGNLFNWSSNPSGGYSQGGAQAIVNDNPFSGSLPTDSGPAKAPNVPALFNNFGTTVYGNIEQIIFHCYDDSSKALVDYRDAVGATAPALEVINGTGSVNPYLRIFAVDPATNPNVGLVNQRSMIRALQFQVDSPVVLESGAVNLTRQGAASYPWYASALPTGAVPISTTASIDGATGRTTVTIEFTTPNTGAFNGSMTEFGSLIDGIYSLGFTGSAAELLFVGSGLTAQNHTDSLSRLYGDLNGDGSVDATDMGQLRNAINTSVGDAGYEASLDFDGNGVIDARDLGQFRVRYNFRIL